MDERLREWYTTRAMSVGDGREGKVRAGMTKGQLGGKLAGLSLPRQIITIAQWPLLEQVLSFICASTSLILANNMGANDAQTAQIASGIGVTSYIMWLGFVMQGGVGMGATAIVSRMTGARRFKEGNYGANQSAVLGMLAGLLSALLMYVSADVLVSDLLNLTDFAREVALRYMYVSCWVAIFSGVVFALNAALRGAGDTRTPFFIMLVVDGMTILFCLLYVYVFGMFVEGLALGLICGWIVAAALLLGILIRRAVKMHKHLHGKDLDTYAEERGHTYVPPIFLHLPSLKPDWQMMYRILAIGLPQAAEVGGIWLIQIYGLHVISSLGDAHVGAHTIAIRIESLSFMPGFAIGMAGATLVGQYLGAHNIRMALSTIQRCVKYSVVFMGTMGVVFYLFPEFFVGIFASKSPTLVAVASPVVQVFLIAEPFYAAMLLIKMCLRGAGYTRRVMLVSFGCMSFFRIGCLCLWSALWPETLTLPGIWLLFTVDMAVEYVILRKMLYNLKWAKQRV